MMLNISLDHLEPLLFSFFSLRKIRIYVSRRNPWKMIKYDGSFENNDENVLPTRPHHHYALYIIAVKA